jgi:hypothetical protein
LKTFPPSEVKFHEEARVAKKRGLPTHDTALCPRCGIDSVLDDHSGHPLDAEFLTAMNAQYFGRGTRVGGWKVTFEGDYPGLFDEDLNWGMMDANPGWEECLRMVCEKVLSLRKDFPTLRIRHFKEKYANLEIYIDDDKECRKIDSRIKGIEEWARHDSWGSCQECGKEAGQCSINHWDYTLCDEHFLSYCEKRGVSPRNPSP